MNLSEELVKFTCGNHSCIYGSHEVGTNGPCHCLDGLSNDNRRKARNALQVVKQYSKKMDILERGYKDKIADLELDIEVGYEAIATETNTATAIYEGNMRKKKILRDRIAELEQKLTKERKRADSFLNSCTGQMKQVTSGLKREKELKAQVDKLSKFCDNLTHVHDENEKLKSRIEDITSNEATKK